MPITPEQFRQQRQAIRGTGNAQPINVPLWEDLIWSGETAYAVTERFGHEQFGPPGWCFDRFGMSRTRLPDGRIICIGGEHEDFYDPDFFIYNDVIVIHPNRNIEIFGYDPNLFPPTDFHSATLIGETIYIISRLGYASQHCAPPKPVYRLDISTMRISPANSAGDSPGWIFKHRAQLDADGKAILIDGGKMLVNDAAGEAVIQDNNRAIYSFDPASEKWAKLDGDMPNMTTLPAKFEIPGWERLENEQEAHDYRDSIVRAVAPDHALFCGEFMVISKWRRWVQNVALQMLDGTGRWAICDGPGHTGREEPPPAVTFYPEFDQLIEAAAKLDRKDRSPRSS